MRGWEGQWRHLGQRVPEDRTDVNNRKPSPPASVRCALRQPFQLHVSWRLDLYAPKTCWVAGLYVNFTRIWLTYTSASPQRSGLSSRRKVIQNVLSLPLPEPAVSLVCLESVDFSQSFQHVSVSQELVFAEIFFFTHSKEMWNTPTFFHTIWEDQIFFSNLWRYW